MTCDKHPDADSDSCMVCLACDAEQSAALAERPALLAELAQLRASVPVLQAQVEEATRQRDELRAVAAKSMANRITEKAAQAAVERERDEFAAQRDRALACVARLREASSALLDWLRVSKEQAALALPRGAVRRFVDALDAPSDAEGFVARDRAEAQRHLREEELCEGNDCERTLAPLEDGCLPSWFCVSCWNAGIAKARAEARAAALRDAVEACDAEARAYAASAKACDGSGNTFGGSMDTTAMLACERCIEAVRALARERKP